MKPRSKNHSTKTGFFASGRKSALRRVFVILLTLCPSLCYASLPTPQLHTPDNGESGIGTRPTLDWHNVTGASTYRVFVATSSSTLSALGPTDKVCSACWINDTTSLSRFTIPSSKTLTNGKRYYWMVRAGSATAGSPNSAIRSFITFLGQPVQTDPDPGEGGISVLPLLNWNDVPGAARYRIFVATSSSILENLSNSTQSCSGCWIHELLGSTSSFRVPSSRRLTPGKKYFWMVRAGTDDAGSLNSDVISFTTALSSPIPSSPINDVGGTSTRPTLRWSEVEGATKYRVFVSQNASTLHNLNNSTQTCSGCWINDVAFTESYPVPSSKTLNRGTRYYWMVRAGSPDAGSINSQVTSFVTGLEAPELNLPISGSHGVSTDPTLDWLPVDGATRYRVFVAESFSTLDALENDDRVCNNCELNEEIPTAQSAYNIPVSQKLEDGKRYFWMARAGSSAAGSPNSDIWNFITDLPRPDLVSPSSNQQDVSTRPRLRWEPVDNSSGHYRVFVAEDQAVLEALGNDDRVCSDCWINAEVPSNAFYDVPTSKTLEEDKTYHWMVRAGTDDAGSPNSSIRSFRTELTFPTVSNVSVSPIDVANQESVTVSWSSTDQNWYGISLYHETQNTPINTSAFLHHSCVTGGSDGSNGCLLQVNPSSTRSTSWTVPAELNPGRYRIQVAVWKSANAADSELSNVFEVVDPTPTYGGVSEWAQEAAHYMVTHGIVEDPADHNLRGTDPANRAEVAAMLYRALGGGQAEADDRFAGWYGHPLTPVFADVVDPDLWYFKPVSYLGRLAYDDPGDPVTVFDQDPQVFRPAQDIRRAWIVKALLEAWDIKPLTDLSGVTLFSDVPANHAAAGYIYAARQAGLISGEGGDSGLYNPIGWTHREHLFVFLHRILESSANLSGLSIEQPIPSSEDFLAGSSYSQIGYRYEQPVLTGVQQPTVSISATVPQAETIGDLEGIHTSTLDALISDLDPGIYVDIHGDSHTAQPFCAWTASGGTFIDLNPGSPEQFCRVKWVAPIDVSQHGGTTDYAITLYVGDGLGSEVKAFETLTVNRPSTSSVAPWVTLDPLPSGLTNGDRIEITGGVGDSGTENESNYGILSVRLRYSIDGGASWRELGEAELLEGRRWRFVGFVPSSGGSFMVEAVATNLRGNVSTPQTRSTVILELLSIEAVVTDSDGQPVENARVTLTGGGLQVVEIADNYGSTRFSSSDHGLVTQATYNLEASAAGRVATVSGLILTAETPTLYPVLAIDTRSPSTRASIPGGPLAQPTNVELLCQDDLSGCAVTYYTVDGTEPTVSSSVYAGPISVGETVFKFFSVDQAGNAESVSTETYSLLGCHPPTSGTWTVSESCEFTHQAVAPADVIVEPGVVLTIAPGAVLEIDLHNHKLLVRDTGGVLVKDGGTIRQTSGTSQP